MEIPSLLYLCFWAIISVSAFIPVRVLLNKVDIFHNHSSEMQEILHTFLCFTLSGAFLSNPLLSMPRRDSWVARLEWCEVCLHVMLYFSYQYMRFVEHSLTTLYLFVVVMPSSLALSISAINLQQVFKTGSMDFFHWSAWVIFSAFTSITYKDVDQTIKIEFRNPFLPCVAGPTIAYLLVLNQSKLQSVSIKIPLTIKIIVGLIGNILASHYLKDKNIFLFWLLVSLAIFWLGIIAMMQSTCQAGIFGFLVGAILDIAGDLFGLNIYMWLVGFGCAVLFIFFEHLDKVNLRYPGGADESVLELPVMTCNTSCIMTS